MIDVLPDKKTWGGFAMMGYNPEEWDNRPHRNQLRMGWGDMFADYPPFQHWIAAHETGHFLGLTQEHQRPDHKSSLPVANLPTTHPVTQVNTTSTLNART